MPTTDGRNKRWRNSPSSIVVWILWGLAVVLGSSEEDTLWHPFVNEAIVDDCINQNVTIELVIFSEMLSRQRGKHAIDSDNRLTFYSLNGTGMINLKNPYVEEVDNNHERYERQAYRTFLKVQEQAKLQLAIYVVDYSSERSFADDSPQWSFAEGGVLCHEYMSNDNIPVVNAYYYGALATEEDAIKCGVNVDGIYNMGSESLLPGQSYSRVGKGSAGPDFEFTIQESSIGSLNPNQEIVGLPTLIVSSWPPVPLVNEVAFRDPQNPSIEFFSLDFSSESFPYFGDKISAYDSNGNMTGSLKLTNETLSYSVKQGSPRLRPQWFMHSLHQDNPAYGYTKSSLPDGFLSFERGVLCHQAKGLVYAYRYGLIEDADAKEFCGSRTVTVDSLGDEVPDYRYTLGRTGEGFRVSDFTWRVTSSSIGKPNVGQRTPICGGQFFCGGSEDLPLDRAKYIIHRTRVNGECFNRCRPRMFLAVWKSPLMLGWSCGPCPK